MCIFIFGRLLKLLPEGAQWATAAKIESFVPGKASILFYACPSV